MKKIFTLVLAFVALAASAEEKTKIQMPKFSGYVQTMFSSDFDDSSAFSVKRVRASVKGNIGDQFNYTVQYDLKGGLIDAIAGYTPFEFLNFKMGQYKIPFSIENTDCSPTKMEFIQYPMGLRLIQGLGKELYSVASSQAGIGMSAYGAIIGGDDFDVLSYDLGIFNGDGTSKDDLNQSKDVAARLRLRPVAGLELTGSYYFGQEGKAYDRRSIYSAGAQYVNDKLIVRSEYFGGDSYSSYEGTEVTSSSVYALVSWKIKSNLALSARFDTFTLDTEYKSETTENNYSIGLSYLPHKNFRVMLNYTFEDYTNKSVKNTNLAELSVFAMF